MAMHSGFGQTRLQAPFTSTRLTDEIEVTTPNRPEQNGCRQRLEGYLSCQQCLALAVA